MNISELNLHRRAQIAKAFAKEKKRICSGSGSRDWNYVEQKQLLYYNKLLDYSGHFVKQPELCKESDVQFLDFKFEYIVAHSDPMNKSYGYYNESTDEIKPMGILKTVPLSDTDFLNYDKTHHECFIGETNVFGVKRASKASESKKNVKDKFGIKRAATVNNNEGIDKTVRKNKYGF